MAAYGGLLTQSFLNKRAHLIAPVVIAFIVSLILIPFPPTVLDIFLSINITLAVSILMVSTYLTKPVQFSVFPSLLLMATLYRLALNISTTRLILLRGEEGIYAAGRVIASFGKFVVGGNYVVGLVVFIVIIAIQYMVVAHGAVRASEVAARFVLDAMPGKQLSIDADLNAGLIDEAEAKARREEIRREAEFYGAMDGAIRFTSREALVSIIITLVNIIGGLLIGILQKGMDITTALKTYTILTVGDGLVAAIPSLLISVAGGLVATRAAAESSLGRDLTKQLLFNPKPVAFGAGLLFFFGLVPGLPKIPFFLISAGFGYLAYRIFKEQRIQEEVKRKEAEKRKKELAPPEKIEALLKVDILGLEIGYSLISLVDKSQGAPLLSRIKTVRKQLALELGIIVPPVRIKDNLNLNPREYQILLKGAPIEKAEIYPNLYLAINPGNVKEKIKGIETKDPAFGLPAFWIEEKDRERAQFLGYTIVDAPTVISTHLKEIIKRHAHEILTKQDTQKLIDNLQESYPKVVEELIPKHMTIGQVQKVLQNLLKEKVSIRDMLTILETLSDYSPTIRDISKLTELVRQALSRTIVLPYLTQNGELPCIVLGPEIESEVQKSVDTSEGYLKLLLPPERIKAIVDRIKEAIDKSGLKVQPVLITSPETRPIIKMITERFIPELVVISAAEIPSNVKVISLEVV